MFDPSLGKIVARVDVGGGGACRRSAEEVCFDQKFCFRIFRGFRGFCGSSVVRKFVSIGVVFKVSSRGSHGFQLKDKQPLPKQPLASTPISGWGSMRGVGTCPLRIGD